jgi:TetR/AcrR family transcriptional repressor of mexJK operon
MSMSTTKPASPVAEAGRLRTPRSRPARNLSPDERRERIVKQSAPLFIEKGYENVSMNDIIEAAGGSKATVYALFGNKEGLFEEAVRWMASEVSVTIDVNISGTLEEQLTQLGKTFVATVINSKTLELHRLMVSMGKSFSSVTKLFFAAGPEAAHRNVARWVEAQQRAGVLVEGDPRQLAVLFLDMLTPDFQLGLLTAHRTAVTQAEIDTKVAAAVRLFLRGCLA